MTAVVLAPKLRLAEGDKVETFGKRKTLQGSTFSHHKTMQFLFLFLSLISLFEHKLDNYFGMEGVVKKNNNKPVTRNNESRRKTTHVLFITGGVHC
jgi:hypothetical protein